MAFRAARIGFLTVALLLGCRSDEDTILVVQVYLADALTGARAIRLLATVKAESGRESSAEFRSKDGPVHFPTSFTLQLPRSVAGPVRLEVVAFDEAGAVLALRVADRVDIKVGKRVDVDVTLGCNEGGCSADGGATDGPVGPGSDGGTGADAGSGRCGNSLLDEGEICDPAIPEGRRGACPPADCDDGLKCTRDVVIGSGCRLECRYQEITDAIAGDGCCPATASAASDPDCSTTCGGGTLEPGETCETAFPPEHANACPVSAGCDDQDACTEDDLISAGTCAAVCAHRLIQSAAPGDGCCPLGAGSDTDPDCPVVCGNGRLEKAGGETCDRGYRPSDPEGCPETCPDDGDPCTTEALVGSGCQARCVHNRVEQSVGGDGCCLPGVGRAVDSDCGAVCGNGVIEPGEFCDKAIAAGMPGACPTSCASPVGPSCLAPRLDGSDVACTARCAQDINQICARKADGCCPPGCALGTDPDCSATCGNGIRESGETCDTGIASGEGACPQAAACADGDACTADRLLSAGTCSARCAHTPVVTFDADGCCPPGGNNLVDVDCPAACGNRVVEDQARESCDKGLPAGAPGACAASCPPLAAGCLRGTVSGTVEACTARCAVETVRACQNGDGCCPPGCTRAADDDCPAVCGNAMLETGETCDWAIPAGSAGACSFQCNDNDACTTDHTLGRTSDCTRSCRHTPVRACRSGDGCCPDGCSAENDLDCRPAECGNQTLEAGERCDPPSSCPPDCIDDGDVCTKAVLRGDAQTCGAYCDHVVITACSGTTADRCCPAGCGARTDVDCGAPPPRPTPY